MNREAIEYYQSISSSVESFCKPLNDYFGISLFTYCKAYKNSKYLLITNDTKLTQSYLNNITYSNVFYRDHLNCSNLYNYILWPNQPENSAMKIYLDYGYWHGVTLIMYQCDNYVELACFLLDKNNLNMGNIYTKNSVALEKFINHFKFTFADKILTTSNSHNLATFSRGLDINIPNKITIKEHEQMQAFLHAIGLNNNSAKINGNLVHLTSREKQCLEFMQLGYPSKLIAQELLVAPKTIETHINNIKQKTGYHYKYDLIKMYREFF